MQMYRIEATVSHDGTVTIKGVPFRAGDKVEVIMRSREYGKECSELYPLRGKPIRYVDPFESVAEDDWEALR